VNFNLNLICKAISKHFSLGLYFLTPYLAII
jgi:hypothetical protein